MMNWLAANWLPLLLVFFLWRINARIKAISRQQVTPQTFEDYFGRH